MAGADIETVGGVASEPLVTVNVKLVVRVKVPAVPVTVSVDVARGVLAPVVKVTVVVQPGEQEAGLKLAEVPVGNPEIVNTTGAVAPPDSAASTVLVTDAIRATDRLPPLLSAKLKGTALDTVTATGPVVVVLFDVSLATAVRVCPALVAVVVSQVTE